MKFTNKVTKKNIDIGSCNATGSEGFGLFRESFYQHDKQTSFSNVPEEIIIESQVQQELDKEVNDKTSERRLLENSYGFRICDLMKDGKEVVLKSIMTRLLLESLELPEDVLECIQGNLFSVVDDYFTGKYSLIESMKDKNYFFKEVIPVCENTAECISRKKMDNCKSINDCPGIKFNLDADDKILMLKDMKNINFSTISNIVKDKVVKTVCDENKRARHNDELANEAQDKIYEKELNELSMKESMMQKFLPFNGFINVPTQTLFESLMIAETNIMIESIVSIQNDSNHDKSYDNEDDDEDEDSNILAYQNDYIPYDKNKNYREDPDYDDYNNDVDDNNDVDMDDIYNTDTHESISEGCCGKKKKIEEGCCNSKETINCRDDEDKEILLDDDDECDPFDECDKDDECLLCDKTRDEIEEGFRVKQAIHRRAKRFKNKLFKKATRESVENTVDMDTVFMEAFTQYTFLEVLNTLGIETFNHEKVKNMIKENLAKK